MIRTITVKGVGNVSARPDYITISMTIESVNKNYDKAMQGDGKLPSLKSLHAEQERLTQEQQRLYDERASLKKQAKQIDTIKANVDMFLSLGNETEATKKRTTQLE